MNRPNQPTTMPPEKTKRRRKAGNPVIKAAVAVAKAIQDLTPDQRDSAVKAALAMVDEGSAKTELTTQPEGD